MLCLTHAFRPLDEHAADCVGALLDVFPDQLERFVAAGPAALAAKIDATAAALAKRRRDHVLLHLLMARRFTGGANKRVQDEIMRHISLYNFMCTATSTSCFGPFLSHIVAAYTPTPF